MYVYSQKIKGSGSLTHVLVNKLLQETAPGIDDHIIATFLQKNKTIFHCGLNTFRIPL